MKRLTARGFPGLPTRTAPWTPEEVENLRGFQAEPLFRPFQCAYCGGTLEPEGGGWRCDRCGSVVGTIAYEFMTEGRWMGLAIDVETGCLWSNVLPMEASRPFVERVRPAKLKREAQPVG